MDEVRSRWTSKRFEFTGVWTTFTPLCLVLAGIRMFMKLCSTAKV